MFTSVISRGLLVAAVIGIATAVGTGLVNYGENKAALKYAEQYNTELKAIRDAQLQRVKEFVDDKRERTKQLESFYEQRYLNEKKALIATIEITKQSDQTHERIDESKEELDVLRATCNADAVNAINRVFDSARDITRPIDYIY